MIGILKILSIAIIPAMMSIILLHGYINKVSLYDTFVEGAKEGFGMSVRLIPFLVGMMVAIGLFRDSGAMDFFTRLLEPLIQLLGIPAEILPLAFMRPVSGSSALAITAEIMNTFGADSLLGRMAATMQGSTDTTLFVLTVYFGAVGIKKTRYALAVGLIADAAGILAAIFICNLVFG